MNRAGLDALRAELGLGLCPAERFRPDSLELPMLDWRI